MVGGPFGSDLVSKDYVDDGVPVIRGQNMGKKTVSGSFVFVNEEKARSLEANMARPGDVVFTQRGTLGQVSLIPDRPFERYLVSQSQMKVSLNRAAVDPGFFYYLFTGPAQQEAIRMNTIQTGVPHINLGILAALPVALPELPEQRRIAQALGDADAFVESLEQLLAKKRHIKQGAMQELLTGKKRLPGFTPKRELKPLRDGVSLLSGQHVLAQHCNTEGRGFPYITGPSDFPDGVIRHSKFTERPTTLCQQNDILVTVKGSGVGTMVLSDASYCISRQLMAVRMSGAWNPRFVHFSLLREAANPGASATGLIPGLSRTDLLDMRLAFPSPAEHSPLQQFYPTWTPR